MDGSNETVSIIGRCPEYAKTFKLPSTKAFLVNIVSLYRYDVFVFFIRVLRIFPSHRIFTNFDHTFILKRCLIINFKIYEGIKVIYDS